MRILINNTISHRQAVSHAAQGRDSRSSASRHTVWRGYSKPRVEIGGTELQHTLQQTRDGDQRQRARSHGRRSHGQRRSGVFCPPLQQREELFAEPRQLHLPHAGDQEQLFGRSRTIRGHLAQSRIVEDNVGWHVLRWAISRREPVARRGPRRWSRWSHRPLAHRCEGALSCGAAPSRALLRRRNTHPRFGQHQLLFAPQHGPGSGRQFKHRILAHLLA